MAKYGYVWLSKVMYGYVWFMMYDYIWVIYGYVWSSMTMQCYVWLCRAMYIYVWLYRFMYGLQGYMYLYNNKINARVLIGQSAMVYCAGKPMEKSRVFSIII